MATQINRESKVIEFTIPNGGSLSDAIDVSAAGGGAYSIKAIYMDIAWTAANLTFQASDVHLGTYLNVYDSAGNELVVTADASRTITDIPELGAVKFIKVRSGTSGTPVNQGALRTLKFLLGG